MIALHKTGCTRCDDAEAELEVRKYPDLKRYVYQCLSCGATSQALPTRVIPMTEVAVVDKSIADAYWQRISQRRAEEYAEQREERSQQWWSAYNAYLESDEWARRRRWVLRRAEGICEAWVACVAATATQVHHLSYRHLGAEPLWELQAVCEACHVAITRMDREVSRSCP